MLKSVKCPGRDLNPYKLALTAPSKLRVYQFHHPGGTSHSSLDSGLALCAARFRRGRWPEWRLGWAL